MSAHAFELDPLLVEFLEKFGLEYLKESLAKEEVTLHALKHFKEAVRFPSSYFLPHAQFYALLHPLLPSPLHHLLLFLPLLFPSFLQDYATMGIKMGPRKVFQKELPDFLAQHQITITAEPVTKSRRGRAFPSSASFGTSSFPLTSSPSLLQTNPHRRWLFLQGP